VLRSRLFTTRPDAYKPAEPANPTQVNPGWCNQPAYTNFSTAVGALATAHGSVCAHPAVLMSDVVVAEPDVSRPDGEGGGDVTISYRLLLGGVGFARGRGWFWDLKSGGDELLSGSTCNPTLLHQRYQPQT